jgi:hypothetical protein
MDAHEMRESAAKWHDQRAHDTPDVFEMEFHQVSAAAIRALPVNGSRSREIRYGDPIRKVGGGHEVDGFLAGVITWEGVEHPVMAIPVAKGFLLHIYAWAQLARRALGR